MYLIPYRSFPLKDPSYMVVQHVAWAVNWMTLVIITAVSAVNTHETETHLDVVSIHTLIGSWS